VSHIPDRELVDHWLEGAGGDATDEHLLACDACSARLRALVSVLEGMRSLGRSAPPPVVLRADVNAMRARGVRVSERSVPLSGEIAWTIVDADVYVLAMTIGAERPATIEVEYCRADGERISVFPTAPFDRATGDVLIACDRHVAMGHQAVRIRVLDTSSGARTVLADCTLRALRTTP
jgi:hypothetical protein